MISIAQPGETKTLWEDRLSEREVEGPRGGFCISMREYSSTCVYTYIYIYMHIINYIYMHIINYIYIIQRYYVVGPETLHTLDARRGPREGTHRTARDPRQ